MRPDRDDVVQNGLQRYQDVHHKDCMDAVRPLQIEACAEEGKSMLCGLMLR